MIRKQQEFDKSRLSSSDWHAVGRHDPAIAEGGQHTNVVCTIGGTIDVDVEASTIITALGKLE